MSVPTRFPFKPDQHLTQVLKQGFTVSAEVIPPRNGAEQVQVLAQISSLIESGAQFIAVTKGAGGSLRGGSLPIAQAVKESFGVPCIAHFTCRDLSSFEVENQLMDHHYFGIRNILALRGDPPDQLNKNQTGPSAPAWVPKEGGYNYAYQLIEQIARLNSGEYMSRAGGPQVAQTEKTDFCIGAAVYPEHPSEKERLDFYRLKLEAGAHYAITDMLFDVTAYARFLDLCAQNGLARVPILPGTRILRSQSQALRMMQKFRVRVPDEILKRLPEKESPDSLKIGLEIFGEQVARLKSYGAPGIHLFVIVDTLGSSSAIEKLRVKKS